MFKIYLNNKFIASTDDLWNVYCIVNCYLKEAFPFRFRALMCECLYSLGKYNRWENMDINLKVYSQ